MHLINSDGNYCTYEIYPVWYGILYYKSFSSAFKLIIFSVFASDVIMVLITDRETSFFFLGFLLLRGRSVGSPTGNCSPIYRYPGTTPLLIVQWFIFNRCGWWTGRLHPPAGRTLFLSPLASKPPFYLLSMHNWEVRSAIFFSPSPDRAGEVLAVVMLRSKLLRGAAGVSQPRHFTPCPWPRETGTRISRESSNK